MPGVVATAWGFSMGQACLFFRLCSGTRLLCSDSKCLHGFPGWLLPEGSVKPRAVQQAKLPWSALALLCCLSSTWAQGRAAAAGKNLKRLLAPAVLLPCWLWSCRFTIPAVQKQPSDPPRGGETNTSWLFSCLAARSSWSEGTQADRGAARALACLEC